MTNASGTQTALPLRDVEKNNTTFVDPAPGTAAPTNSQAAAPTKRDEGRQARRHHLFNEGRGRNRVGMIRKNTILILIPIPILILTPIPIWKEPKPESPLRNVKHIFQSYSPANCRPGIITAQSESNRNE